MAHPLAAEEPYIWMTTLLDLEDGADVETWPFVANGTNITSAGSTDPTLDVDFFDDNYHAVAFPADTAYVKAGAFTQTANWTLSILLNMPEAPADWSDRTAVFFIGGLEFWVREGPVTAIFEGSNNLGHGSAIYGNTPTVVTLVGNATAETVSVYFTTAAGVTTLEITGELNDAASALPATSFLAGGYGTLSFCLGNISFLPRVCDAAEVDEIAEWLLTIDPYYLGGGLARALQIQGAPAGTKVDVRRIAHPGRGSIDCTLLEDPDGTYFDVTALNGETEVLYRAWYDLDEASDAPADGGRTLVPIAVETGFTADEIADATATALDGTTYLTAFASGAVAFWTATDNGTVTAPADGDTGAIITELAAGGTATDQVGYLAATAALTEQITYLVARPFDVTIGLAHEEFVVSYGTYTLTLGGYTAPASALLQPDFAYDAATDPSWTKGTEWQWTPSTRTLDLNTASTIEALYFALKEWTLNDADGLQYAPALRPVGFDAYRLMDAEFGSGDIANVRRNGFHYADSTGAITDEWICLQSGVATLEGTAYFTQVTDGTPVDAAGSGIVDQAIQVYDAGVYDYRDGITLYARPWGKTWGAVSTFDQGITVLRPKTYVCALPPIVDDLSNTTARSTVAAWSDITLTVGADTDEDANPYDIVIDGAGRTVAQVYERCKYLCDEDQTGTIDGTAGRVYRGQELRLPYSSGSGTSPEGGTVTGGASGAVCHVIADHGDALTLRRTDAAHGLGFEAGETLTATSWTATAGTPERYTLDELPLCHLEGGTLVGARGVLIEDVAGTMILTDAEGVQHTPPVASQLTIHCVDAVTGDDVVGAGVRLEAEAGGDIAASTELLNDTTDANGEVALLLYLSTAQPATGVARKGTETPYYDQARLIGVVIEPGSDQTITAAMVPQE